MAIILCDSQQRFLGVNRREARLLAPIINLPAETDFTKEDNNKDLSVFLLHLATLFDASSSFSVGQAQSREARERVTKCLSHERDKKRGGNVSDRDLFP